MGQQYQFHVENDELLSEAERAFDLSARQASMPKQAASASSEPVRRSLFPSIAGLFSFGGASERL
ncbi:MULTISPECIES: hypothetical protein [unclassified Rhizobium]|uniref:hypothetical protein n=1 Tax=unclassified Rhizobium TaxID=2613769 RepID=UPI000715AF1C|nr:MULTISPECIES: hypothetical protein [unclassified Rhizobium]KQS96407.1 hypothetical protein ASG50_04925 [Rhizobium sp. Leaf386]KQT06246.1 hypothetical protein ASG42_01170 [Rhizobium sp. Leaf391]KQU09519.1 hypothetical protein ASG68_00450 [Rhizobium sp. Leaf453]